MLVTHNTANVLSATELHTFKRFFNGNFRLCVFSYNLFSVALGLHCCMWAFSSCSEWGLLFIAEDSLLILVASLVSKHGLQVYRL